MKKRIANKNILIIFFCVVLFFLSIALLSVDRKYTVLESTLKTGVKEVTMYFTNKLYKNNIGNYYETEKIKKLNKENNELKNALELKKSNDKYIVGEVINHTSKNWYNRLELNKGKRQGIKINDVVINNNGLVGFISKTSKNVSEVNLLTNVNKNNEVSVLVDSINGQVAGVLSKYNDKSGLFKVIDVTSKNEIKDGSSVVLSGYNKENYKDIYIGKVVKQKTSNYGLTKTLYIKSAVNFDDLLYLTVVGD